MSDDNLPRCDRRTFQTCFDLIFIVFSFWACFALIQKLGITVQWPSAATRGRAEDTTYHPPHPLNTNFRNEISNFQFFNRDWKTFNFQYFNWFEKLRIRKVSIWDLENIHFRIETLFFLKQAGGLPFILIKQSKKQVCEGRYPQDQTMN